MTKQDARPVIRLRSARARCGWCWSTGRARLAMGGDRVDCGEDRLHGRDAARLGAPGRARQGLRAGPTTDERERIKALERENRELRQANEILRKASAYFAQAELDRRSKP